MGGFTRILHSGNPDNLMDEIPTMVVDPLPAGLDRGYIVLNRPWAFDQWLFEYIQGKNKYGEKIEMTAPVLSEVSPSDGPFCESSFVVSFYVPKKNQENPPPAEGLHLQKWKTTYVAVRQFSGFVSDDSVGEEAAALKASLAGTVWSAAIEKSHAADHTSVYTVNLREHNEEQVMLLC
ncbi:heme-binding protein 2 [Prunus persica]|uniref:heme-binding protein 2 n=1 Tax=Prunus persica TaxID=3760 RepID=UPI0009AB257E|nr:heme-binding protein 2 [Prunus persica]